MGRPTAAAPPDSEEELDAEGLEYMLGFLDEPEHPTALLRHRFPSKVGGAPAWLDPLHLPTRAQLTCSVTGEALRFLLQVYCPVDSNPVEAFHRTLFLFVSPRGDRLLQPGAVRALRCQLPRANPFYDDAPAPPEQHAPRPLPQQQYVLSLERDPWRVLEQEQRVAAAGGSAASPVHACEDETAAAGAAGSSSDGQSCSSSSGPALFQESELLVEPEPQEGSSSDDDGDSSGGGAAAGGGAGGGGAAQRDVARLLAAYRTRVAEEGEYDDEELPPEVVDDLEGAPGPAAAAFAAFQARAALAPEQCLRYCFEPGAAPLWPSHAHVPRPEDVPPCSCCGAARRFEFQVMPQLLSLMDLDPEDPHAPDWGTIAVYSCPASCSARGEDDVNGYSAYVEEFVWVQPAG